MDSKKKKKLIIMESITAFAIMDVSSVMPKLAKKYEKTIIYGLLALLHKTAIN
jgi:hypothetical protein